MSSDPNHPHKIRRANEILGEWDRFTIRVFIANGSLLPSDEVFDSQSSVWKPLLPPYRRTWTPYDWSDEDDTQWYYIKDGCIVGPRLIFELSAMFDGGFLNEETRIAQIGSPQWMTMAELLADLPEDDDVGVLEHVKSSALSWIAGDHFTAGAHGAKAVSKLWGSLKNIDAITSDSIYVLIDETQPHPDRIIEHIESCGHQLKKKDFCIRGGKTFLQLQFHSIQAASAVRDDCEGAELTRNTSLYFCDVIDLPT